ncbi:SPAC4G8.04 TBC domain-containing protein C4G8.04 [Candida maltosa Xu316]
MISKNHDISNLYFEKEWDTLIKDINIHHNMLLQDDVVIGVKFGGVRGLGLQQFYFPLVNLITQYGIPDKYRFIWLDLSGANNIRINGEYNELLSTQVTPEIQKIFNEIDLDLHRTLPSNFFFNNMFELKPGVNFYKLQRILYAFVIKFPEIGYVQGMNKIIGTLLLTEHDEENVFCLFIALIQEILPWYSNKPFFNSIEEIQADNIKLKELLKMFIPELYTHFMRLNVEIEILSMSWWLTLFIDLKIIDLETWFKVIDNLLIGDRDTFFPCLTLSILKCLESTLLRFDSCDLIYRFLSTDNSKFNMKFSDLMKHYIYYSRKKEISEIYRHQ